MPIHRESDARQIHRTAPNDVALKPPRPLTPIPIHRESQPPKEGPTS
ncbi:hypothetical protein MA6G0125S_5478 [Mycobacteroides abscessus 6G-0125-S]|nr:hypothetical protein MA6G0125S_5478 [Mycobacteroides abscessus 6G-0125-S]EIU64138.1 hypothetical protein MA6G0728S_5255 [Mycobacteroides abscessus 6G-0728-S]